MPSALVHAAVYDLPSFGELRYFDVHKQIDAAHKWLGYRHRTLEDHSWYVACGELWTPEEPFPEWLTKSWRERFLLGTEGAGAREAPAQIEQHMVFVGHCWFDRLWDRLSCQERLYRESFAIWVLFHPEEIRTPWGVDLVNGRIQRLVRGRETWEEAPHLPALHIRLRSYAQGMLRRSPELRGQLERYG